MVTKLADVYANVNTEKNVFYSAYMKGKIQYNDVDPNKIMVPGISHPLQDEVNKSESEIVNKSEQEEVKEEVKDEVKEEVKEEEAKEEEVKEEVLNVSEESESVSESVSVESESEVEVEVEEESDKIIVTIHDINSPKSSTNDLQAFNDPQ